MPPQLNPLSIQDTPPDDLQGGLPLENPFSTPEAKEAALLDFRNSGLYEQLRANLRRAQHRSELDKIVSGEAMGPSDRTFMARYNTGSRIHMGAAGLVKQAGGAVELGRALLTSLVPPQNQFEVYERLAGMEELGGSIREAGAEAQQQESKELEALRIPDTTFNRIAGDVAQTGAEMTPQFFIPGGAARTAAGAALRTLSATERAANAANVFRMGRTSAQIVDTASKVGQTVGVGTAAAFAGGQSAGENYDQNFRALMEQGMSEAQAKKAATLPSIVQGMSTAILTGLFGATGVEASAALDKLPRKYLHQKIIEALRQANFEGGEEAADQIVQFTINKLAVNPNQPASDVIGEALYAYLLGFGFGGTVSAGLQALQGKAKEEAKPDETRTASAESQISFFSGDNEAQSIERRKQQQSSRYQTLSPLINQYNNLVDQVNAGQMPEEVLGDANEEIKRASEDVKKSEAAQLRQQVAEERRAKAVEENLKRLNQWRADARQAAEAGRPEPRMPDFLPLTQPFELEAEVAGQEDPQLGLFQQKSKQQKAAKAPDPDDDLQDDLFLWGEKRANREDIVDIAQNFVDRMSQAKSLTMAQQARLDIVWENLARLREQKEQFGKGADEKVRMLAKALGLVYDPAASRLPARFVGLIERSPWWVAAGMRQDAQPPGAAWEMEGRAPDERTLKEEEGTGVPEPIDETAPAKPGSKGKAPAKFAGYMGGRPTWNTTEDIGVTPKGSTMGAEFFVEAGYEAPVAPPPPKSEASQITMEVSEALRVDPNIDPKVIALALGIPEGEVQSVIDQLRQPPPEAGASGVAVPAKPKPPVAPAPAVAPAKPTAKRGGKQAAPAPKIEPPAPTGDVGLQIEELAAKGLVAVDIAQKLGMSPNEVEKIRKDRGIPPMYEVEEYAAWREAYLKRGKPAAAAPEAPKSKLPAWVADEQQRLAAQADALGIRSRIIELSKTKTAKEVVASIPELAKVDDAVTIVRAVRNIAGVPALDEAAESPAQSQKAKVAKASRKRSQKEPTEQPPDKKPDISKPGPITEEALDELARKVAYDQPLTPDETKMLASVENTPAQLILTVKLDAWFRMKDRAAAEAPAAPAPTPDKPKRKRTSSGEAKAKMAALAVATKVEEVAVKPITEPAADKNAKGDAKRLQELSRRLASKLGNVSANPADPEVIQILTEMGYIYMKQGLRRFGIWSKWMLHEGGSPIIPLLTTVYRSLRVRPEFSADTDDDETIASVLRAAPWTKTIKRSQLGKELSGSEGVKTFHTAESSFRLLSSDDLPRRIADGRAAASRGDNPGLQMALKIRMELASLFDGVPGKIGDRLLSLDAKNYREWEALAIDLPDLIAKAKSEIVWPKDKKGEQTQPPPPTVAQLNAQRIAADNAARFARAHHTSIETALRKTRENSAERGKLKKSLEVASTQALGAELRAKQAEAEWRSELERLMGADKVQKAAASPIWSGPAPAINLLATPEHISATLPQLPDEYLAAANPDVTKGAYMLWRRIHEFYRMTDGKNAPSTDQELEMLEDMFSGMPGTSIKPQIARTMYNQLLASYIEWMVRNEADDSVSKALAEASRVPAATELGIWLNMSLSEMDAHAKRIGTNANTLAYAVGRSLIKTERDVFLVVKRYREILLEVRALKSSGKNFEQHHALRQFLREAVEAATGSGSAGDVMKLDPVYKPNVNKAVDFVAILKESDTELRQRIKEPFVDTAMVQQYKPQTTMRTGMIEQEVINEGDNAVQSLRTTKLTEAELAYLGVIQQGLRGKTDTYISNDLRKAAFAAARKYGFVGGKDLPPDEYPRLIGLPEGSPVSDRLFRGVRVMKNGFRTIAIERDDPRVRSFYKFLVRLNPKQAGQRDHIISTNNRAFKAFLGFTPQTPKEVIDKVYRDFTDTPSREDPFPVKYRRIPWKGDITIEQMSNLPMWSFEEASISKLSEDELDSILMAIDRLEPGHQSRTLLRDFEWDMENKRYQVTTHEMDMGRERTNTPYMRNEPRFVSHMLWLYKNGYVSFGELDKGQIASYVKDGKLYTNVSVPGVIKPIAVPVEAGNSRDQAFVRFVHALADGLAVRWAGIRIRNMLGVPATPETVVPEGAPRADAGIIRVNLGAPVKVKLGNEWIDGVVTEVKSVQQPKAVGGRTVAGVTQRFVYTVATNRVVTRQDPADPTKTISDRVTVYDVERADITPEFEQSGPTADWVARPVLVARPKVQWGPDIWAHGRRVKPIIMPELFDGEPIISRSILDLPIRFYWQANYDPAMRQEIIAHLKGKSDIELIRTALQIGISATPDEQEASRVLSRRKWSLPAGLEHMTLPPWYRASRLERKGSSPDAMERGRLVDMIQSRIAGLYNEIGRMTESMQRIKSSVSRETMRAVRIADNNVGQSMHARLEAEIREHQASPPDQSSMLIDEINAGKYLPPPHALGHMRVRLVNSAHWNSSKWRPRPGIIERITKYKMGMVLVNVKQSGRQMKGNPTIMIDIDPDGGWEDKTIEPRPAMGYLAIDGDKALIQVVYDDESGNSITRTLYEIDLTAVPEGIAEKFEHVIPSSTTGGKPKKVSGYYLDPYVFANSGRDEAGNSLWGTRLDPRYKDYMSIEDFKEYVSAKISLDGSTIEAAGAPKAFGDVTVQPETGVPTSVSALMDQLESIGPNEKLLAAELEGNHLPLLDDAAWEDLTSRIADVILGKDWDKEPRASNPAVRQNFETLSQIVELSRERQFKKRGEMAAVVTGDAPTVADVSQELLNRKFTGKDGILEFTNATGNGMTEASRSLIRKFIESLPDPILKNLSIMLVPSGMDPSDKVRYAGSFSHAVRLAKLVAGSTDTKVALEEIAHSLALYLPEEHRNAVEEMRTQEITRLAQDESAATEAREFAQWLLSKGGAVSSEQFLLARRAQWVPYYSLVNTDEFFAHNLTSAGMRANKDVRVKGAVGWATNWLQQFLSALKRWVGGYGVKRDAYFDKLLKEFQSGNFTVEQNGGYLHEINANTDIGNVAIAFTPSRVERIAASRAANIPNVGTAIMGQNFTLNRLMSEVESEMFAEGIDIPARAYKAIDVDNRSETVKATRDLFSVRPIEYQAAKLAINDPYLSAQMSIGAMGGIMSFERKLERARRKYKYWSDYVYSDKFNNMVIAAQSKRVQTYTMEAMTQEVDRQIKLAIAAAQRIIRIRASQSREITDAQQELNYWNMMAQVPAGIGQKMLQMVQRLSDVPEYVEVLMSRAVVSPARIVEAYRSTNPPPEEIQVADEIIYGAAYLLARNENLRSKMLAAEFERDEAVLASLPGMAARWTNAITGKSPAQAIRSMMAVNTKAITAQEKAKFLLSKRDRAINRALSMMDAYEIAIEFGERLMAKPEWVAYRKLLADDVGEAHVPKSELDVSHPQFGRDIKIAAPISGKAVVINFANDAETWGEEQAKAYKALQELDEWLSKPENQGSIAEPYYRWHRDFAYTIVNGSMANDFSRNYMGGLNFVNTIVNKTVVLIDGILRQSGNRVTQLLVYPLRAWRDSELMMGKWQTDNGPKIIQSISAAAQSHPEIASTDASAAAKEWYDTVGRELFSLSNSGWSFRVGDRLPVGNVEVTAEDIEAMRIQSDAIDQAMAIDITRGRAPMIMPRLVEDQWVPGFGSYMRKTLKTYRYMLPRNFNMEALDFTQDFVQTLDKNPEIELPDLPVEAMKKMQGHMYDAVLSFLVDRDPDFTSVGIMEEVYAAAADEIRNGTVQTIAQLARFLRANTPATNIGAEFDENGEMTKESDFDPYAQFVSEFVALQRNLYTKFIAPRVATQRQVVGGVMLEQENSFTLGRGPRVAPFYWYNYGLQDTPSLLNFVRNGSSFYIESVLRGLEGVQELLKLRAASLRSRIGYMRAREIKEDANGQVYIGPKPSESSTRAKFAEQTDRDIKEDKDNATLDEIEELQSRVGVVIQNIQTNYLPGGRVNELELSIATRIFGTSLGSLLATPIVAVKNWWQSGLYFNAKRIYAVTNSMPIALGYAAANVLKQALIGSVYLPIQAAISARKIHGIKASKEIGSAIKAGMQPVLGMVGLRYAPHPKGALGGLAKHIALAEMELVADMTQDFCESLYKRGQFYTEMKRRGLMIPMNIRDRMSAMAESLGSSGVLSEREMLPEGSWKRAATKIGKGFFGFLDLQLAYMRHIFPALGDRAANVAGFNTAMSALQHMEAWLRKRYEDMRSDPASNRRITKLLPSYILPSWFGESRNYTSLNLLQRWFDYAAVDLKVSINDFFARLDAAGDDPNSRNAIEWLSREQMFNLAQAHIEDLNIPTPTNRPQLFNTNWLWRMVGALLGWRFNAYSTTMAEFGKAARRYDDEGKAIGRLLFAHNLWFVAFALGLALASESGLEEIIRLIARLMTGEERSTRQVWETQSLQEALKLSAVKAMDPIPFVAVLANMALNDQPARRSATTQLVVQSQTAAVANYVAAAFNSGDWTHGLDSVLKTLVPMSRVIINNLPAYSGRIEAMDSRRLLTRYGDKELIREARASGVEMWGNLATPISPYADRMVNAAMHEDYEELQNLYEEAVQVAKDYRKLGDDDARQLVRQMYTSRNPYTRTFKTLPTAAQRTKILNRMQPFEREQVVRTEELLRRGARAIGTNIRYSTEDPTMRSASVASPRFGARSRLMAMRGGGGFRVLRGRLNRRLTSRLSRL